MITDNKCFFFFFFFIIFGILLQDSWKYSASKQHTYNLDLVEGLKQEPRSDLKHSVTQDAHFESTCVWTDEVLHTQRKMS